jgi:methyltransferase family protein
MIKFNKTSCFVFLLFSIFLILFLLNGIHRIFSNVIYICDCELSRSESDDFFCETDDDWYRRKELFYLQHNRNQFRDTTDMFFQDNYEPTFSCRFEQRLGINGDGGKWICDPYRLKQLQSCLIYSFGSNGEFSFENETKRYLPNCDIHTFDTKEFNCTDICTFHQVKIGDGLNGTKTLRMIVSELNHANRYLDILKIDVEGSEYEFFDELFNKTDHLSENIRQILVEIHLSKLIRQINNDTVYDFYKIHRLFRLFHDKHFVIFHKEVNLYNPHNAFEFSLIRLNEKFFKLKSTGYF